MANDQKEMGSIKIDRWIQLTFKNLLRVSLIPEAKLRGKILTYKINIVPPF